MIYGNEQGRAVVKQYVDKLLETGKGVPFLIVVGPRGVGKSSYIRQLMQEKLGDFYASDFLYVQDYSELIGRNHTLPVEINDSNKYVSKKKKKEEESDSSNEDTFESTEGAFPNIWVREINAWLQKSWFSSYKGVLIENLERANGSTGGASMNALLKTLEEPLPQRIIFATIQQESQILPTILSRAVIVHFSLLSDQEMEDFIKSIPTENLKGIEGQMLQIISEISMGRPWIFCSFLEKIQKNPDLWKAMKELFESLGKKHSLPLFTLQNDFLKLIDAGMVNDFVDGWILSCTKRGQIEKAQQWINAKKLASEFTNTGISREKLFLSLSFE